MIIYIFFLLGSFVSTKCLAQDVAWIEGCVYEDGNQNGIQDKGVLRQIWWYFFYCE